MTVPNRYPLVAMQYVEGAQDRLAAIQGDVAAELVREPDNPADRRAVAVYVAGGKLGFVPGSMNTALAASLDRGEPYRAVLTNTPKGWRVIVSEPVAS